MQAQKKDRDGFINSSVILYKVSQDTEMSPSKGSGGESLLPSNPIIVKFEMCQSLQTTQLREIQSLRELMSF